MRTDNVESVGRRLMKSIKAPPGGFYVMTFTLPDGERVLRVLLQPRYSAVQREIPTELDGVKIFTEIDDLSGYTLH